MLFVKVYKVSIFHPLKLVLIRRDEVVKLSSRTLPINTPAYQGVRTGLSCRCRKNFILSLRFLKSSKYVKRVYALLNLATVLENIQLLCLSGRVAVYIYRLESVDSFHLEFRIGVFASNSGISSFRPL